MALIIRNVPKYNNQSFDSCKKVYIERLKQQSV